MLVTATLHKKKTVRNISWMHTRTKVSLQWRAILDLQHIGQTGVSVTVGNGQNTAFWTDRWLGDCALASSYHHLYQICSTSHISVYEVVLSKDKAMQFTRQLTGALLIEFNELYVLVSQQSLSLHTDQLTWRWDNSGKFFTHFVYDWLMFRGIVPADADIWWSLPIPLKIKVFMWLLSKNRILTKEDGLVLLHVAFVLGHVNFVLMHPHRYRLIEFGLDGFQSNLIVHYVSWDQSDYVGRSEFRLWTLCWVSGPLHFSGFTKI